MKQDTATLALAFSMLMACGDDDTGSPVVRPDAGANIDATVPDGSRPDGGLHMDLDAALRKTVTLRFRATFGSTELRCGEHYLAQGSTGATITPRDVRFYVERVELSTATGSSVPMTLVRNGNYQTPEVALLDFTDRGGECGGGPGGLNTTVVGTVPAGDYRGASLVIGVPEELNHADPTKAPAPLQAPGANWDWLTGYRFFIAEVDTPSELLEPDAGLDDGGPPMPGFGLFHLGSTGCTKNGPAIRCMNANRAVIRLPELDPDQQSIVVDLSELFRRTDLKTDQQCHSSGAACGSMFESIGVVFDGGTTSEGQTVFRVE